MLNNFSVSSLKLLEIDLVGFRNKYEYNLNFNSQSIEAILGDNLHKLIYYKIKGFDISKLEKYLEKNVALIWKNLTESEFLTYDFIDVEKSFFVKLNFKGHEIYLNGRFDCVYKSGESLVIMDWKTKNLPQNPIDDLQTVVYLFCASKLYNTSDLSIKYVALTDLKSAEVKFVGQEAYKKRIFDVLSKYYNK